LITVVTPALPDNDSADTVNVGALQLNDVVVMADDGIHPFWIL
jgi:hypothetical protein